MNILLAEDDIKLGELIEFMLVNNNYTVDWVNNGEDAFDYAMSNQYDVLVLDWMMPREDGISVCRRLRKDDYTGAILILTAKDSLQDRINGLDAGADDYLIKPFEIDELLARLRALTRRNFAPFKQDEVVIHDLILNRTSQTVSKGNEQIQLSPREFQLLDLLVQNSGQVLPREVILDRIWGYDTDVSYKAVDATVKLLRKKLETFSKHDQIESIRGVGYRLEV